MIGRWSNLAVAAALTLLCGLSAQGSLQPRVPLTNRHAHAAAPAYHSPGGITDDGQRLYEWTPRLRLKSVRPKVPEHGDLKRVYGYDALGRRIQRQTWEFVDGTWGSSPLETRRTVYAGFLPLAEYTVETGAPVLRRTYVWGPDLSGGLGGAGGVGGLLAVVAHTGPGAGTYLAVSDARGNVAAYVRVQPGGAAAEVAATFEYAPFGDTVGQWYLDDEAEHALDGAPRFATKLFDSETGLYYFGYRHYDPKARRWLSRDPLAEAAGPNLYAYCHNDPINNIDPLGLASETEVHEGTIFYTWHLGWLDSSHYRNETPAEAWRRLQAAEVGETLPFTWQMRQTGGKTTTMKCEITVADLDDEEELTKNKKEQLLWVWMRFSEVFEDYQLKGLQANPEANLIYGIVAKRQWDKQGSGRSTEDLVSNLVAFYAAVENERPEKLIADHAGVLDGWNPKDKAYGYSDDSGLISMALWKTGFKCRQGDGQWRPKYFDHNEFLNKDYSCPGMTKSIIPDGSFSPRPHMPFFPSITVDYVTGTSASASRAQELVAKYLRNYGGPTFPEFFQQYTPTSQGVVILETTNE